MTKRHWPLYALSFVGFLIYGVSNAAFAHTMKLLIDSIQAGERRMYFFPLLIIGLFAGPGHWQLPGFLFLVQRGQGTGA